MAKTDISLISYFFLFSSLFHFSQFSIPQILILTRCIQYISIMHVHVQCVYSNISMITISPWPPPLPSPPSLSRNPSHYSSSLWHLPDVLICCAFLPPKKVSTISYFTQPMMQKRSYTSSLHSSSLCHVVVQTRLWSASARADVQHLRAAVVTRRCVHAPRRVLTLCARGKK